MSHESEEYRAQALEAAKTTEDYETIALVYAMTYIGDQLRALRSELPTLAMLNTALPEYEAELVHTNGESPTALPRLARTLQADSPFTEEPGPEVPTVAGGKRQYRPAHDPRLWRIDPDDGMWISPKGRKFHPQSQQVRGVIIKLERMRTKGTLYTTPIRPLDEEPS